MGGMTGNALLSLAIRPKTESDQERLARGVRTLLAEDPTMSVNTDQTTGEIVIAGMGELHLEIIVATQLLSLGWRGPRLLPRAYWAAARFVRTEQPV
jgi:hypothetical protein